MGWSDWFKDSGGEAKEKVETTPSGATNTHWLRDTGGSKADHVHIVQKVDSGGKKSAHSAGNKSKRS